MPTPTATGHPGDRPGTHPGTAPEHHPNVPQHPTETTHPVIRPLQVPPSGTSEPGTAHRQVTVAAAGGLLGHHVAGHDPTGIGGLEPSSPRPDGAEGEDHR